MPSHDVHKYLPIDSAVTPRFAQGATFMRTPWATAADDIDIALVGVPFFLIKLRRLR